MKKIIQMAMRGESFTVKNGLHLIPIKCFVLILLKMFFVKVTMRSFLCYPFCGALILTHPTHY